jgi:TolB-like protein
MSDRDYDQIISQFPELKKQLSRMLCNIQVVQRRYHTMIMADRYLRQLQRLIYMLQCDTTVQRVLSRVISDTYS